jgi:ubiquinone/menaquinone biosynthesis C-methylase UbiE
MADAFPAGHGSRLSAPERLKALPQADVVRFLQLEGCETVVDYGAGTGVYTEAVAEALSQGLVIAVEALPELAEQLRERLGERLLERVNVVVTADNHVPVEDGCADRVVMVDVLHHLYDQPGALDEAARLLRPGGLFVVIDWGAHERPVGPPLGHVLGLEAVRTIASDMGLEEVEVHDQGDGLCCHVVLVARKPAAC